MSTNKPITGESCLHPLGYEDWSDGTKRCTFCMQKPQPISLQELEAMEKQSDAALREIVFSSVDFSLCGKREKFVVFQAEDEPKLRAALLALPKALAEIERLRAELVEAQSAICSEYCSVSISGKHSQQCQRVTDVLSPKSHDR